MFRIVACVYEQHNLWLILLAAAVCAAASAGAVFVLSGVSSTREKEQRRWMLLAGMLAGVGTWATHFVSMLGYDPGLPINFALSWTILSVVLSVIGCTAAFAIFTKFRSPRGRAAAGAMLGASIVAMHYTGMAGVQASARQVWAFDLVAASLLCSVLFSIATFESQARMRGVRGGVTGAILLALAIVSLHFTGMGALTLVPDPTQYIDFATLNRPLLAITVATAAAAVLLTGVVVAYADRTIARTELAAARSAAQMALHDALTGLPNRRHLFTALSGRLTRKDAAFAVVAADLDRFKPVNDLYGHAAGDQLLTAVAKLFSEAAGADGFVARIGGDEFVLILPFTGANDLIGRLSALVTRFAAPIEIAEHHASIGVSLGIAIAPADGGDPDTLLRRADVALYRAKSEGRGGFAFFEEGMDARVQERAELERDLRLAVGADEIMPHFQPLVRLESGAVTGYEILARWTHRTRGAIDPAVFVQIASETGLISDLTFNILRRACRQTLNWEGAPRISLNVAPSQLRDPALPQKILAVLSECGFPPARLVIEITEDALVQDFETARALLVSLKNLGVRIALDDFGTGYSSLRHLRELPFDDLKIDRSFVHSMTDSEEALTIVKTIVHLAQNLGLGVTAEGIETASQARQLQSIGCESGQGFLLGPPAPGDAAKRQTQHALSLPAPVRAARG
jgi:diguanylate cyclase (GGDEF)-like protein